MKFKLIPYQLYFKYIFKIAHTQRESTENLYLVLQEGGNFGIGEAIFPPYQPERWSNMVDLLNKYCTSLNLLNKENCLDFLEVLYKENPQVPSCVAALDMAILDFFYKDTLCSILHLETEKDFISSYTIGISTPEDFEKKVIESDCFTSYYKFKIDQDNFEWVLDLFPRITNKKCVLDANQGFVSFTKAVECATVAHSLGVQYLEQPFEKSNFEWHKKLKELAILPIIADESFQNYNDLEKISTSFDGVNIKLMKCGGLFQASKIIKKTALLQLKTVFGCMSDSIIGIESAQKLAHLTNWVDLDGHLLNVNNPSKLFLLKDQLKT